MKTSDKTDSITAALVKAQKAITFAVKDSTNPHFKNRYADLQSVIEAIKTPLNENGIFFSQSPTIADAGYLALTTRLCHESGQWIEDTATIPLPKNDPQGYGSALTYGRRYALAAICGLYQADDDGEASRPVEPVKTSVVSEAYKQAQVAINAFAQTPEGAPLIAKAFTAYNIKTVAQLSETQAASIVKRINELKK